MALEFVSGFIVSSLLQDLVDKIKASAVDTIALAYSCDVEKELKNLEAVYVKALSMLDMVDGWDLISSKLHREWVADIRRACYETEDFTERVKLEILEKKGDAGFLWAYWVKWGLSSRIRDLQSNLKCLTARSDIFTARSRGISDKKDLALDITPMVVPDDESFVRKQDKESIIQLLLGSSSSVVVITGMFGVGKSMLARVVKSDLRIQHHFDHILWVSISGNFNLMEILSSMIVDLKLEQAQEVASVLSSPIPEQQYARLFQSLCKKKRVLIVLDDLCNFMKPHDWEDFQSLLDLSSVFGIIITTRNPKIATKVASFSSITTASYYLQRMSNEDCGLIIQKKGALAAVNKRMRCGRSISEVMSIQIAEEFCKGLPLVANIIGHHLSLNNEDPRWPIMLSKDLWTMEEFREHIFPAFRLNYFDFPLFLKNCFPYFSLFPEQYDYKKDDMVRLWWAEGYIKPQVAGFQYPDCSEYSALEELGDYYFNDILSRSILQIYHPFDHEPQIYKMHEFVHRYAMITGSDMYVQLDENLASACCNSINNDGSSCARHMLASAGIANRFRNSRHLSLLCPTVSLSLWKEVEQHLEGLRTILSLREHISIGQLSYTFLLKLQSLRVLNLSGTDISELPESVGKLKNLRLLDVSKTDIQEFPASITDLQMLHFLKADQCPLLLQLPKKLMKLTQLIHLELDIKGLSSMPPNMGKLINLRTLPAFIVGIKDGFHVSELKNMKYLEGSICLMNLENVKDEGEAKEAMLQNKPLLKRVELEWNRYSANQSLDSEKILWSLEPSENLEELEIIGYNGTKFPSWLSSPKCNLTSITLLRCDQCGILPALGQLQYLKILHIEEMHCIETIDNRFSGTGVLAGFPSLELLKLQDLASLKKWEGLQASQMACLRELNITDCPNLVSLPSLNLLSSMVNLEISYCPQLLSLPGEGLPLSLEKLVIVRCELLTERCLPEKGADWEKIKTIGKVVIDFVQIPTLAGHI